MKVLFLLSTLERSGPTNVIYNIIKHLNRSKVTPIIVTLSPEPSYSRKADFEALKIEIHTFNRSRFYWLFSSMTSFKKMIAQINPDLIHSHSLRGDISSAKHLSNYYRISTVHSDLFANYKIIYNVLVASIFTRIQIKCIKQLNLAIACSKTVFEIYKERIDGITYVQNGIDTDLFFPKDRKNELRRKLKLPLGHTLFISIGSLDGRKDPETVINGFLSNQNSIMSSLVILGKGHLEKTLKEKYQSNDRIILKGFVSNVNDYLQASDFYISASYSEGLPNTVLEALGCAVPVCLSDIPSHREILEINPKGGVIFGCGSTSELSLKIGELLLDNQVELQQAALDIINEKLNAKYMSSQYQNIYLSINKKK